MRPPSDLADARWGGVVRDAEPDAFDESQPVPATTVTLVEGASFTICGPRRRDRRRRCRRVCSSATRGSARGWSSAIDGGGVEPLSLATRSPSSASFVGRTFDKKLLVFRDLWVGQGMRVDLRIRNLARESRPPPSGSSSKPTWPSCSRSRRAWRSPVQTPCEVDGSDAPVPGRREAPGPHRRTRRRVRGRRTRARSCGRSSSRPRETWEACVELRALRGGEEVIPTHPCGQPSEPTPTTSGRAGWRSELPDLASDVPGLAHAFRRGPARTWMRCGSSIRSIPRTCSSRRGLPGT